MFRVLYECAVISTDRKATVAVVNFGVHRVVLIRSTLSERGHPVPVSACCVPDVAHIDRGHDASRQSDRRTKRTCAAKSGPQTTRLNRNANDSGSG